jgi:general secretion pathway protein K
MICRRRVRTPQGRHRADGIALVLVLWATTLLTVIAASFAFSIRTDTQLAQNMVALSRAQALADAGVQRAVYELFKPETDKLHWRGNGVTHDWEYGGAKISVVIQDVAGKIDLNVGNDLLLKGLFKNAGLDDAHSAALVDAVADWRDADDLRRLNGAEAAEYAAAGLKYKPANAPFETVDELKRVLGMTPELFVKLENSLTVESKNSGINVAVASKTVLMAIPGVDEVAVDAYVAARQAALEANLPLPAFPQAAWQIAANAGSTFNVRAQAVLQDGATFVRETVVRVNPGAGRKVAFLSWTEGRAVPMRSDAVLTVNDR